MHWRLVDGQQVQQVDATPPSHFMFVGVPWELAHLRRVRADANVWCLPVLCSTNVGPVASPTPNRFVVQLPEGVTLTDAGKVAPADLSTPRGKPARVYYISCRGCCQPQNCLCDLQHMQLSYTCAVEA